MSAPVDVVWAALERLDCEPHGEPSSFRARCPAHQGENTSSLHVTEAADRRALIHCFSGGCGVDDVREALGLDWDDLFGTDAHHHRRRRLAVKPRTPIDLVLQAVRTQRLDYRCTAGGHMWIVETCPACLRHELWLQEDERG